MAAFQTSGEGYISVNSGFQGVGDSRIGLIQAFYVSGDGFLSVTSDFQGVGDVRLGLT